MNLLLLHITRTIEAQIGSVDFIIILNKNHSIFYLLHLAFFSRRQCKRATAENMRNHTVQNKSINSNVVILKLSQRLNEMHSKSIVAPTDQSKDVIEHSHSTANITARELYRIVLNN